MSPTLLLDVATTILIFGAPLPGTAPLNFLDSPVAMESLKRVCQQHQLAHFSEWKGYSYYNALYWANHNHKKVRSYPQLEWLSNLPSKEIIAWNLELINETQDALNRYRIGNDWDQQKIQQANQELMWRHQVWSLIERARTHLYWCGRREALRDLRKLVGDEVFVSGHWPVPVPFWIIPDAPRRDR